MRFFRYAGFLAGALVILCCTGAGILYVWNKRLSAAWQQNSGLPGRMVDAGGTRVYIEAKGEGQPPVVILSALGATGLEWARVRDLVSTDRQVIIYDRPGYGLSEAGKFPRTVSQNARDLDIALKSAGLKSPYTIVGHSYGGIVAVAFAKMYPDQVKGVVLVDPAPQTNDAFKKALSSKDYDRFVDKGRMFRLVELLGNLGLIRAINMIPYEMDDSIKAVFIQHISNGRAGTAALSEYETMETEAAKFALMRFPPVKLVVMCRTPEKTVRLMEGYGVTKAEAEKVESIWRDEVQRYTLLSPDSELIMVPNTTHMMDMDQPEAVARGIAKAAR